MAIENNAFLDFVRQQQACAATSGGDNKSMGGAIGCITIGLGRFKSPWEVKSPLEALSTPGLTNSYIHGPGSMFRSPGGDKYAAIFHQMYEDIKKGADSIKIGIDANPGNSWQIYISTRDSGAGADAPSFS